MTKNTTVICATLLWVISLVCYCIFMHDLSKFTIIGVTFIQFIAGIIILKVTGYKILSFAVIFYVFLTIFHAGQLFLEFLNINAEKPFDIFFLVKDDVLIKSIKVYTTSQFFLILGYILTKKDIKEERIIETNTLSCSKQNDLTVVYQIGLLFFEIGLIPRIYVDISQFIAFFNSGYLATYKVITNNYITLIAYFFQIGTLVMIIGSCDNKKKSFKIAILTSIYLALTMAKGGRGTQVVSLVAIWFTYFKIVSKPSKKTIMKIIIVSYLSLCTLSVVGNVRNFGASGYQNFGELLLDSLSLQTIWNLLGEFGGSAISLCYSVKYFPYYTPFLHGLTFLTSFLILLPNTSFFFSGFTKYWVYVDYFPKSVRYALGGSIYGELYANFGFKGTVIVTFVVGIILGKYSNNIDEACERGKWKQLALEMMLFPSLLMWVRGYFADTLRQYTYSAILFYIIYKEIMRKRIKNNENKDNNVSFRA